MGTRRVIGNCPKIAPERLLTHFVRSASAGETSAHGLGSFRTGRVERYRRWSQSKSSRRDHRQKMSLTTSQLKSLHSACPTSVACAPHNEDNYLFTQLGSGSINAVSPVSRRFRISMDLCTSLTAWRGGQAGEVASHFAVQAWHNTLLINCRAKTRFKQQAFAQSLKSCGRRNERVDLPGKPGKPELTGMGTTLTAAAVYGTTVTVAQLGDSPGLSAARREHHPTNEGSESGCPVGGGRQNHDPRSQDSPAPQRHPPSHGNSIPNRSSHLDREPQT